MGQDCSLSLASRSSAWDKNRAIFLPAAPRGTRIVRFSFPRLRVGQESCDNSFPRLRVGQESHRETLPPFGRDKKRAAKPSRRSGETRIAPRNLPDEWFGSRNSVSSLPPSGLEQETRVFPFPPLGRDKKRATIPSRGLAGKEKCRAGRTPRAACAFVRGRVAGWPLPSPCEITSSRGARCRPPCRPCPSSGARALACRR